MRNPLPNNPPASDNFFIVAATIATLAESNSAIANIVDRVIQDCDIVATISIICDRINRYFETDLFKHVIQTCNQNYVTENHKLIETQNAVGWFFHHLMELFPFPDEFYSTHFFDKNRIRIKVEELISEQIITDVQEIWEFLLSVESYFHRKINDTLYGMFREYTDAVDRMENIIHELTNVLHYKANKFELYISSQSKEILAEIKDLTSVENELKQSIEQLKQTINQQKQDIDQLKVKFV